MAGWVLPCSPSLLTCGRGGGAGGRGQPLHMTIKLILRPKPNVSRIFLLLVLTHTYSNGPSHLSLSYPSLWVLPKMTASPVTIPLTDVLTYMLVYSPIIPFFFPPQILLFPALVEGKGGYSFTFSIKLTIYTYIPTNY